MKRRGERGFGTDTFKAHLPGLLGNRIGWV